MFSRKRILVKELLTHSSDYLGQDIQVCGWIETMRVQKVDGIAFISLNDGSSVPTLQIILDPQGPEDLVNLGSIYQDGTKGVSIEVKGTVVESPAKGQEIELKCHHLKVLGKVKADEYPIAKKKLHLDHLRKYLHLRIRTKTIAAVSRIRNACSIATHEFFQKHKFQYVHTPLITGNDCEGAGETFDLSNKLTSEDLFFGKKTNLTVSGQLHGETYATGLGDIYTFGPTFRAENSNTTRHLAEFWMIEPEMCFIEMSDLIDISEDYLKYCISYCLGKCGEEIDFFTSKYQASLREDLQNILVTPFTRMTYTKVIETLLGEIGNGKAIIRDNTLENKKFKKMAKGKHVFEEGIYWGCDLSSEHEKYMTDKIIEGPLIVTDYPKEIKSFYMKENEDGKTVQAMDLLVPNIGELIGGSMREDDYDILKLKMEEKGLNIDWYLDLRKYGSVPHGGFGMGFERLIMLMTGIHNIRDIIPYPRYPKHCDC